MDFSTVKKVFIPEGEVKQISREGVVLWKGGYTNLVPTSLDIDGSIYNGTGYKDGSRLSSSGSVKDQTGTCVSGLIPAANGDIIRSFGWDWNTAKEYGEWYTYIGFYDSDKNWVGSWNNYHTNNGYPSVIGCGITEHGDGVITYTPNVSVPYAYVRLNLYGEGKNLIITVNEEIT